MFTLSSAMGRRRDGRSPLLLAAALAVAVPGFLVTACSGQASSATSAAASRDGATAAAGGSPAVAGKAPAVAGNAPATGRRHSSARAVRLLNQAAQAAILTSYQGEEVASRWSDGNGSILVSDVWHVSGGQTVTQTLAAGTSFSSQPYLSSDTDGQAPEGVLGVTLALVQLLQKHYVIVYAGTGSADSRTAQVSRPGGTTAAWPRDSGWTTPPSCPSNGWSSTHPPA